MNISRKQISPLTPHNHPRELANNFSEYFINKIKKIQCELSAIQQTLFIHPILPTLI